MNRLGLILATISLPLIAMATVPGLKVEPLLIGFSQGVFIGKSAIVKADGTGAGNIITRSLGTSAVIDFSSTVFTTAESSAITVTGAKVGDTCFVGAPAAAGALKAEYTCYVSAADAVKVKFQPLDGQASTVTLSSGTPSTATATVSAGAVCNCTNQTTQANSVKCNVSATTLTVTGPNTVTDVVGYECQAPVDPPSGTFYVRVLSSQ